MSHPLVACPQWIWMHFQCIFLSLLCDILDTAPWTESTLEKHMKWFQQFYQLIKDNELLVPYILKQSQLTSHNMIFSFLTDNQQQYPQTSEKGWESRTKQQNLGQCVVRNDALNKDIISILHTRTHAHTIRLFYTRVRPRAPDRVSARTRPRQTAPVRPPTPTPATPRPPPPPAPPSPPPATAAPCRAPPPELGYGGVPATFVAAFLRRPASWSSTPPPAISSPAGTTTGALPPRPPHASSLAASAAALLLCRRLSELDAPALAPPTAGDLLPGRRHPAHPAPPTAEPTLSLISMSGGHFWMNLGNKPTQLRDSMVMVKLLNESGEITETMQKLLK